MAVKASKVERVVGVINRSIIQKLGDKEMDRKDFLKYSGLALLGVVGLQGLLSLISKIDKPVAKQAEQSSRGYGGGRYGV